MSATLAGTQTESLDLVDRRTQQAIDLMRSYAQRTGLTSDQRGKRYLWTDAFAVCNYLGLARTNTNNAYTELALKLIDQVHHSLGRNREDDPHEGWISGLGEHEGELHPTVGGLRIGKALSEREPGAVFDARLEWERDGQYFHYLTKWMHALDQVTRATGQIRYNFWARELAVTAYEAFSYAPNPGPNAGQPRRRMVWKKSIDLTRTLVPSMGKHDPLDGYITSLQLASSAASVPPSDTGPTLEHEIRGFVDMVNDREWTTDDPLGIGGLLIDAYRLQQLRKQGVRTQPQLLGNLLDAALTGLRYYTRSGELQQSPHNRLAFRELGLVIGLHALTRLQHSFESAGQQGSNDPRLQATVSALMQYTNLREHIIDFWLARAHQRIDTWIEHRDINEVMLATSLAPDGFLELPSPMLERP
jgi:hypothetical protein